MASRKHFSFDDDLEDSTVLPKEGRVAGSSGGGDSEWDGSNIRGFSFEDDDPFEGLNQYRATSDPFAPGIRVESSSASSRPSGASSGGSGGASSVVSDRVRAASAAYAAQLDRAERGGGGGGSIESTGLVDVPTTNDVQTLRIELLRAKRNLEKIQEAKYIPLHPKETVKNIYLGNHYSLEFYRSLSDKKDLLAEAVAIGDGNVILTVLLYLKKTLSRSKFAELLIPCPSSVSSQLTVYLERRRKLTELSDLYSSLGRYSEAALVHYKAAAITDPKHQQSASPQDPSLLHDKAQKVKYVLNSHFGGNINSDTPHVTEHVNLLERASPVLTAAAAATAQSTSTGPIVKQEGINNRITVFNLLSFCAANYYEAPENLYHSPLAIKKCHKLTERQFVWPCLVGRSQRVAWQDCEALALAKGWLGGKKIKADIDPLDVSRLLHSREAPPKVLRVFVELIEDLDERQKFARKVGIHTVVVDVFVALRDRLSLESYKHKLLPQSEDWHYANNALTTTNTKWKN